MEEKKEQVAKQNINRIIGVLIFVTMALFYFGWTLGREYAKVH